MDRQLVQQKKGLLTDHEIKKIVKHWEDNSIEEDLDPQVIQKKIKKLERKFMKFNVSLLGSLPEEKEDGTCRVVYCQFNNYSSREVCQVKIGAVQQLNKKYDVDIDVFF